MTEIVITGARGYIGTALARFLAAQGRALRLVSRRSATPPSVVPLGDRVTEIEADLGDDAAWAELMRGASAIVHLSARTDLRAAEANPAEDEVLNVQPVRALLEAAARADAPPKIVFASTVTVFGPSPGTPAHEQTPDNPCSVYDRHKAACEALLHDATVAGLVEACSLRLSSVYGLGGASVNPNRGILNVMMRRALAGEALTVYGDGNYTRDFIHLDDVVQAFAFAADADANVRDGSRYVIATGQGHTLAEAYGLIADAAREATGRRPTILGVAEPADLHPIERRNFVGDSSLFCRRTGWRPTLSLPDGVARFFAGERVSSVASRNGVA